MPEQDESPESREGPVGMPAKAALRSGNKSSAIGSNGNKQQQQDKTCGNPAAPESQTPATEEEMAAALAALRADVEKAGGTLSAAWSVALSCR
jgi:hypothetical protein